MEHATGFTQKGEFEAFLWKRQEIVVGVDEVGRGCLAGPVYAGALILNPSKLGALSERERTLIRDSKTLSEVQRFKMAPILTDIQDDAAIGIATVEEIETKGILGATFLAMKRAITGLNKYRKQPLTLLVDGNQKIPHYVGVQHAIVKGDRLCYSIAAASIFAKNARDQFMKAQSTTYPNYGFEQHVGYGTKFHLDQINRLGICPLHRRNFAPISKQVSFDYE